MDTEPLLNPVIVREAPDWLAVNKPSGLASAALADGQGRRSVVDWLTETGRGADLPERGLVHRLDTGTSGLLLIAKTLETYEHLREEWRARRVEKRYRARVRLTSPFNSPLPFRIDWPIGHDAKSKKKMKVVQAPEHARRLRGKPQPAVTWIESLEPTGDGHATVLVRIETGVQHQIRAHLSALGLPLEGDSLYGGTPAPRLGLHAEFLSFKDQDGLIQSLTCPAPF